MMHRYRIFLILSYIFLLCFLHVKCAQEDMSMNDETILKQIANSTALSDITFVSSGADNTTTISKQTDSTILSDATFVSSAADDITFTASIFNNDDLSKRTSSSDSIDSPIENVIHNIT